MIDIENEVFSTVATQVRASFPKIYMVGEFVKSPSQFPCVSLVEVDNQVYRNTRSSSEIENHAQLMYEVQVFTNDTKGKKAKCKEIIGTVDNEMKKLGFTRTLLTPIPNEEDATIYRMVGRYRAIVDKYSTIYRR